MDFDFTDDQQALRDAVRRWVDKGYGFERHHAQARSGGASRAVYAELADLGLAGLVLPEVHGGLGLGAVEAMVVCEELGRGLVNAPYAEAALMAPLLLSAAPAALQAAWLPRMARGEALVVPALQERRARHRLDLLDTFAAHDAAGWRLDGAKLVVPAADEADAFVVAARLTGDGPSGGAARATAGEAAGPGLVGLFLVQADAVRVSPYPTQDGARAGDLRLSGAAAQLICADGGPVLQAAVDTGSAAVCAEAVGLMDRLLALTVEYMNTRRQFGSPLSGFQALRHRVADAKMQLELARSMSYYASLKLGEPPAQRHHAVAQARVQLSQSMRFLGQQCIQLHGGIGCTDDCQASHYFKRLAMLELSLGDGLHHLAEVSAGLQDRAGVVV